MGAIQNLRVAILGAGYIGCYLGGHLQAAGCAVEYIGRSKLKWDIDMKGLTLSHFKRKQIHIPQKFISYSLSPVSLAEADVILVCVKSQDTWTVASTIAEHAKADALVVSCQNGIDNQGRIESHADRQTLGAVVPFNVTLARRGELHSGTEGDLILEACADKRFTTLVKAFRKSGMGVKTTREIADYQWGKLLINLNNALSALSGDTLRAGLSQKSYRKVLSDMIEEGFAICTNAGLNPKTFGKASIGRTISILRLPNMLFGPVMNKVLKIDETARSSMLDDLEAGKNSEVDFLQGEIVRLADETGQFAPINSVILAEVHAAFRQHVSPKYSGDDLLGLLEGIYQPSNPDQFA